MSLVTSHFQLQLYSRWKKVAKGDERDEMSRAIAIYLSDSLTDCATQVVVVVIQASNVLQIVTNGFNCPFLSPSSPLSREINTKRLLHPRTRLFHIA
jgi:hypothetical protein